MSTWGAYFTAQEEAIQLCSRDVARITWRQDDPVKELVPKAASVSSQPTTQMSLPHHYFIIDPVVHSDYTDAHRKSLQSRAPPVLEPRGYVLLRLRYGDTPALLPLHRIACCLAQLPNDVTTPRSSDAPSMLSFKIWSYRSNAPHLSGVWTPESTTFLAPRACILFLVLH
jgi:hypothetical protein